MRRLASLATARWQSGHRKQYEPRSSSAQTRTVRSSAVNCTSPQLGQLALIVVTASPVPGLFEFPPARRPGRLYTTLRQAPLGPLESSGYPARHSARRIADDAWQRCVARGRHHVRPPWCPPRGAREHDPGVPRGRSPPASTGLETDVWLRPTARSSAPTTPSVRSGLRRYRDRRHAPRPSWRRSACRASPTCTRSSGPPSSCSVDVKAAGGGRRARRGRAGATTRSSGSGCAAPTSTELRPLRDEPAVKLVHSTRRQRSRCRSSGTRTTSPSSASTR